MLDSGSPAPLFILPNQSSESFSLANIKDNSQLVLFFYPKDNTPGCTHEAKDFSSHIDQFNKKNCIVRGISCDSVDFHRKFIEKYKLKIDLLSDFDKLITKEYGVLKEKSIFGKKYFGIVRTTFLIGDDLKIKKVWESVKVKGHAEQVLKFIG